MIRKSGFPTSTCSIKLPDGNTSKDENNSVEPENCFKKRQELITFGHTRWGFNNWSWSVTKQDLDFIDFANGKFSVGVVAFVSVSVKSLGIHREDVGYATSVATQKGSAIHNARKSSVTNALRETLMSFGGNIATLLMEQLELTKAETEPESERSQILPKVQKVEPRNAASNSQPHRKDSSDSSSSGDSRQMTGNASRSPQRKNASSVQISSYADMPSVICHPRVEPHQSTVEPINNPVSQAAGRAPVNNGAKAALLAGMAPPLLRPPVPPPSLQPPNVSYVVQRLMPPLYSVQCSAPSPPPSVYHNAFYSEFGPWPLTYENFERNRGNVNLNYNVPPKNFVMNSRSGSSGSGPNSCQGPEVDNSPPNNYMSHPVNINGWIKPTIFYDGFWTEQKVKKWVSEQNEKSFTAEEITQIVNNQNQMCHSKV